MKLESVILAGLFALVSAHQCGSSSNAEIRAIHASLAASSGARRRDQYRPPAGKMFEVPTFFHVITLGNETVGSNSELTGNSTLAGNATIVRSQTVVPPKAVEEQLAVLNTAYNPVGFSFVLNETAFIPAPEWRDIEPLGEMDFSMKTALRRGDYATLNVYVTPIPAGIAGYATFPGRASKDDFVRDGVVVSSNTLPDVDESPYNRGITLVHEVGHWLSLLHTFSAPEGAAENDTLAGCRGHGDYIYDTPAEGSAAFDCQIGRDTCTGKLEAENPHSMPGPDPIHNYMDYSDDACLYEFTPMQVQRMTEVYVDVRVNYVEGKFEGRGQDQELEEAALEEAQQKAREKAIDRRPVPGH